MGGNFNYGSFCAGRSKGYGEGSSRTEYSVRNSIRTRLGDAFKGMHDANGLSDEQYDKVMKIVKEIV